MQTAYACARFSAQHLKLADRAPIGMGNRRYVFAHPTHPDLCIKLARTRHIRRQLDRRGGLYRLMPTRWRDDNWLEARAYQQPALRDTQSGNWLFVPRLHGWQATDRGVGLVFDYYRTAHGAPAPNLADLLAGGRHDAALEDALADLRRFLARTDLWMRHPVPANIVWGADGRLKLIDCLGTYNMHVLRHLAPVRYRRRHRHIRYLNGAIAHLQHNTGVLAE